MHNSKLIQALQLLNGRQLTRFAEFVSSPYFNKNGELVLFFGYLQKYAPDYSHKNIDKKNVLKNAPFLGKEDTKKLANLMSQLLALLEKFMLAEQTDEHPLEGWLLLADSYHEAKLDKHYNSIISKSEKWTEQQKHRDPDYFKHRFWLQKFCYDHSDANKRSFNPKLQEASDALDQYYILEKLRFSCEMVNFEKTLNIQYRPHFVEPLLAELEQHEFSKIPAISIYILLLQLLSDLENSDAYFELKEMMEKYHPIFPDAEQKQIYTALLNFCPRRVTVFHDNKFEREYFLLNTYLLDKGLLLENGELSPWSYSNLVTVALRLGEVEWTKNFIHHYKKLLPKAHAENLFQYKSGQYFYHTGKLADAQLALQQVELKDPFLALSVKNLLAKIYYESAETELLLSFLEAYRIYILRDKLTKAELQGQLRHFIYATRKLAKIAPFEKEKLIQLKSALPPEKEMMHRDWVLRMIERKLG